MSAERVVHPFAPVFDKDSEILILGSFPSVVSREKNFYYAHKQNRFWPVLSALFHEEIQDRKQFVLEHHIALWDVIRSCTITGSTDATIRDAEVNDIASVIERTNIRTVFTTGGTAAKLYRKYIDLPVEHIALPSTSAANAAMRMDDLIRAYSVILEKLNEQ